MAEVQTNTRQRSSQRPKTGYLPSLDGWRAIAILGVLMTHDRPWNLFGHSSKSYMGYGGYGVYLFFAISGFLITTRILEEESICGYFDIRRFYIRRIFRIQPAALAYLAAIALLIALGLTHYDGVVETWHSWMAALLLVTNFTYHPSDPPTLTGHFWTLAVEEHFYILLSLLLLFFKRHRALVLGAAFAAALTLYLFEGPLDALLAHIPFYPAGTQRSTQWQLSSLFLAAFVAALVRWRHILQFVQRYLKPWVAFAATLPLALLHNGFGHWLNHEPIRPQRGILNQLGFVAMYVVILWIVATVFHPRSLTTRLLETRPLRFLGRISYSVYLWHVMVNFLWHRLFFSERGMFAGVTNHIARSLLERPARVATYLAISILSYYLLEKPLIRVGHRLAPPATPGRPELADLPVETPRISA